MQLCCVFAGSCIIRSDREHSQWKQEWLGEASSTSPDRPTFAIKNALAPTLRKLAREGLLYRRFLRTGRIITVTPEYCVFRSLHCIVRARQQLALTFTLGVLLGSVHQAERHADSAMLFRFCHDACQNYALCRGLPASSLGHRADANTRTILRQHNPSTAFAF